MLFSDKIVSWKFLIALMTCFKPVGAGETAPQLTALTALPGNQVWFPAPALGDLQPTLTAGELMPFSGL